MRLDLKKNRGFTLIELLVVIAIIGLLSAVILASLNTARAKGADAAIKAQLRDVQSQAAIIYDNGGVNSYATVCSDTTVTAQVTAGANDSGVTSSFAIGTASTATLAVCHSTAADFAIIVPLKTDNTKGWCVDDSGKAESVAATSLTANTVLCP